MRETAREEAENPRIDYGIIFSVMMLALIGLASIYVAAVHDKSTTNVTRTVAVQILWYAIGIAIVAIVMQFDSEQLWRVAPLAYGVGIILLVAVLFLYSRSYYVNTGAKSWFALGPFTFQPSEVMKPAFILMLARVVMTHNNEYPVHQVQSDLILIGKLAAWTLPVAILLELQHDFGTMLVFFAIVGGVMLVSGVTWKILVPLFSFILVIGGTAITFVATSWGRTILGHIGFESYQFSRIDTWLHPANDTSNSGYQLWQSMKAIGSGQIMGKGFNHTEVYVPVRESDMIFSVIGENFGFIGSTILILLYFLLIYQMIRVTFDTKNEFYAYISTGVIMMILFHTLENIGMNIGLLPLTGIPLPFISQGGSALIGNLIGVGLVMSMRFHHKSYMFSSDSEAFN
ncbi:rod shape-determining protein RodA [Loigolactobacillus backii]|uniref:FtsW/RodA/SpoVE family cell cycle protein n=1 Tax=Loigolactobacillus backii TaxID=375175 RepID=UPI000C1C9BCE|nr:FtsW/RodA/SpoVE family cell cycle protein [Loigolactobacillus backii]PIO83740.1 rod shape-determining protein RodA [Loigolactobacillus backii]